MNAMAPMPTRRSVQTLEAVRSGNGGFDADAWHVMEERDNALIADEIINGAGSSKFVYSFPMPGVPGGVSGISVVGARHLAAAYGGIRHTLVASQQKIGSLFTFTSFPQPGMPMMVQCSVIPELADEDDFYGVIVEIKDIKTGNSVQMEKRENRYEKRRDGTIFERPHYSVIAQSKAYRNGVLAVIPQDVQIKWKLQQLTLGKDDLITGSVMEEKRAGVLRFAAAKGITMDRRMVEGLTIDQIAGLSDAAKTGMEAFTASAAGLGVVMAPLTQGQSETNEAPPSANKTIATASKTASRPARATPTLPVATNSAPAAPAASAPPGNDTGFAEFLADEYGEVILDATGADQFTDAISYAQVLTKVAETAHDINSLMELNAPGIEAAKAANAVARRTIEAITASPKAGTTTPAAEVNQAPAGPDFSRPVLVNDGGRGPQWIPYVKAVRESLLSVNTGILMAEKWVPANLPTILRAPAPQRLQIVQAITAHCSKLACPVPTSITEAIAPANSPPVDLDQQWVTNTMADLAKLTTEDDILGLGKNSGVQTKMERLRSEKPTLFVTIDKAFKEAILKAQAAAEGASTGSDMNGQAGDPGYN